ncbi:hypothetical protein BDF19DRAFT_415808 [Syncephalis fuscata]|nr:hypothetical protein BDF19DRAFT_415808 [Syncephalis fuscata]
MLQRGMSVIARSNHDSTVRWTLELCQMMEENGKEMGIGEFHILLAIYARQQQPRQAGKIVAAMRRRSIPSTATAYNLWIGSHIDALDLFGALAAYEEMQKHDVKSNVDTFRQLAAVAFGQRTPCNLILDRLALYADADGADYFLAYMLEAGITPNSFTYEKILDAHQQRGNVASVTRFYKSMLDQGIQLTQNIGIRMIVFFVRLMNEKSALSVLDDMEKANISPDVFGFTALIHLYAKLRDLPSAINMFKRMQTAGIQPTRWTLNSVIRAYSDCGRLDEARQVIRDMMNQVNGPIYEISLLLKDMRRHDVKPANVLMSAIINAYVDNDLMDEAHQFLDMAIDQGLEPRTRTFNLLLVGYSRKPDINGAIRVVRDMVKHDVEPDKATYDLLIRLFSRMADPVNAVRVLKELRTSDETTTNEYTYAPLLAAYAAAGDTEADEVTYTTLICRLADTGYIEEAERIFNDAHQQLKTARAYNALISMYTQQYDLTEARRIYNELLASGIMPDSLTYTLLMQAYVIAGDAQSARAVMDELQTRGFSLDIVHYTTLLKVYAHSRDAVSANELRNDMIANNVPMDRIAWLWLFRAFSYQYNMLWEAWDDMLDQQQASPQAFSVIVNSFSNRANVLRQAFVEWEKVRSLRFLDLRNYNQLAAALAKRRMLPEACQVLEALHQDKPLDYIEDGKSANIWTWAARALVTGLSDYRQLHGDVKATFLLERMEKVAPEILTLVEDEERIRREGPPPKPKRRPDDPRGIKQRTRYRDVKLN